MSNTGSQKDSPLILVVDDEKSMRILLRRAMERQGYQVVEAHDGQQCLEECARQIPDIILLDAMMPVMDGFTCCEELQKLLGEGALSRPLEGMMGSGKPLSPYPRERTPVLMITGLDDPESVDRAFEAGATDYVTKPIHWPVLRQRVHRLLQNGQLIRELQQQTKRERLMTRMLERIRQSLNLEEILKTTVAEVRQFLQTDRVLIYRFYPDCKGVVAVESAAPGWESVLGVTVADPCLGESIEPCKGYVRLIEDLDRETLTPCHRDLLTRFQVKANLVVPIIIGKPSETRELPWSINEGDEIGEENRGIVSSHPPKLWGLLIAHNCVGPRRWQASEIEFVERLATQVAIAIQQSQLYQQLAVVNTELKRLASLDGLTGVANRRHFDLYLNNEWRRSVQDGSPLALILCDVDFFKLYNDTYGHQAGDECLKKVAHGIQEAVQLAVGATGTPLVARYGGEEFAVILPNAEPEKAFWVAQKIHHRIAALQIPHIQSKVSAFVSLSLGAASSVRSGLHADEGLEALIAAADQALYQAKQRGRDRAILQTC